MTFWGVRLLQGHHHHHYHQDFALVVQSLARSLCFVLRPIRQQEEQEEQEEEEPTNSDQPSSVHRPRPRSTSAIFININIFEVVIIIPGVLLTSRRLTKAPILGRSKITFPAPKPHQSTTSPQKIETHFHYFLVSFHTIYKCLHFLCFYG